MIRSFFTLLLTAPVLSNNVRGGREVEPRNLQGPADDIDLPEQAGGPPVFTDGANVLEFVVTYELTPEVDTRGATDDEFDGFTEMVHNWMVDNVVDEVLELSNYALDPEFGVRGCSTKLIEAAWLRSRGKHINTVFHKCKFEQLEGPEAVSFMARARSQGQSANAQLKDNIERLERMYVGYPWSPLASVSTTNANYTSFVPVGSSGSRQDRFGSAFVLPSVITWSFNTRRRLAVYKDYEAVKNATKVWVENYWDALYPTTANKFARRTVEVSIRSSSFSPQVNNTYRQSLSLGLDILVGADNITHVPTSRDYTTTMQIVGRVSNFTEILDSFLPPGSVYGKSNRTGFAMTNTFEVLTVEESMQRGDPPIRDDFPYAGSTFEVVVQSPNAVPLS